MNRNWRQFDQSRDWSKASAASKFQRTLEMSIEAFRSAGLPIPERMDKTIRRPTLEQMRQEDEELEHLLTQNRA